MYTDGVTEAMNKENQLYGEDRLENVLNNQEIQMLSGEELLGALNQDLNDFSKDTPQADDITMVTVSYRNMKKMEEEKENNKTLVIAAKMENLDAVLEFVTTALNEKSVSEDIIHKFEFCMDEIFANITSYAYEETGDVIIRIEVTEKDVLLWVEDYGIPYNPLEKDNPDVTLPAQERQIGGLGIFLVKSTVDDISYTYEDARNKLCMKIFR
jgi:sigma-B regulation protein RsbU (phosphoserine phosphatase)